LDSRGAASTVALRSFAAWDAAEAGQKELSRGYYLEQIQRWLAVIDRSQLLVLNFVDLVGHTTDTVTRLCTFLGIDPSPLYTANESDEGSEDRRIRRRSTKSVGTTGKGNDEAVVATAPVPEIVLPAPPSWNKYFTMEVRTVLPLPLPLPVVIGYVETVGLRDGRGGLRPPRLLYCFVCAVFPTNCPPSPAILSPISLSHLRASRSIAPRQPASGPSTPVPTRASCPT